MFLLALKINKKQVVLSALNAVIALNGETGAIAMTLWKQC